MSTGGLVSDGAEQSSLGGRRGERWREEEECSLLWEDGSTGPETLSDLIIGSSEAKHRRCQILEREERTTANRNGCENVNTMFLQID